MSRTLKDELRKRGPFASPAEEATLSIVRTHDRMMIRFVRLFREFGLTPSQYNILRILRGEGKPLPILEIAERTITVVPGITGLVDRLETAGFVERRRCAEDRRVIFVALTAKGTRILADLDGPIRMLHAQLHRGLSANEIDKLIGLLAKVRATLDPDEP
ncbi:MAG TPA: MarR family transcriptional regulator [Gemmataceae bacterium]|jgi:DNA-binding MarR family transcriptional regulator|nr:MarR family transcriptional regulator [Gemmataceae bacterium]